MKANKGRQIIAGLLEEPLSELGFSHAGALSFSRPSIDGLQLISFSCRHDKERGICFSFGAGVRFQVVEDLLGTDPEQRLFTTIGKPLSVLKNTLEYPEWCFTENSDLSAIRQEVMRDIESYALPFLDQFSTLVSVQSQLKSADPRQWFVLDSEQRTAVLAAITHLNGDSANALLLLDEALGEKATAPAKKRVQLERLRARLLS